MDLKTQIKLVGSSLITSLGFISIVFFFCIIMPTLDGLMLGVITGLLFVASIILFVYPILFREYIEQYWKEYENKNMQNSSKSDDGFDV